MEKPKGTHSSSPFRLWGNARRVRGAASARDVTYARDWNNASAYDGCPHPDARDDSYQY
jgi:hypothetical protein